jgi:hypothetical protein
MVLWFNIWFCLLLFSLLLCFFWILSKKKRKGKKISWGDKGEKYYLSYLFLNFVMKVIKLFGISEFEDESDEDIDED